MIGWVSGRGLGSSCLFGLHCVCMFGLFALFVSSLFRFVVSTLKVRSDRSYDMMLC